MGRVGAGKKCRKGRKSKKLYKMGIGCGRSFWPISGRNGQKLPVGLPGIRESHCRKFRKYRKFDVGLCGLHPMGETAKCRSAGWVIEVKEASANCVNALIGKSVEKSASDGGPCLPSPIAPIAAMSRPCENIGCRRAAWMSKSGGETRVTSRIRSAAGRESGALIRAGIARSACGKRSGHRCAAERESGALIRAGIARSACGERSGHRCAAERESGALIRAGIASSVCGERSGHRSATKRESGALIRAGVGGASLPYDRTAPWRPWSAGEEAETAGTARTSKTSTKWASMCRRDFQRKPAQLCGDFAKVSRRLRRLATSPGRASQPSGERLSL
jgi:hypothetical protein